MPPSDQNHGMLHSRWRCDEKENGEGLRSKEDREEEGKWGLRWKEEVCKGDVGMQSNEIPSTILHFPEPVLRD